MKKVILAFDVDGTLITNNDPDRVHGVPSNDEVPHVPLINMLMVFSKFKNVRIVVWSGGGKQYAETWGRRLGLDNYVWRYASKLERDDIASRCDHLIAIDDIQDCELGLVNLIVRNK